MLKLPHNAVTFFYFSPAHWTVRGRTFRLKPILKAARMEGMLTGEGESHKTFFLELLNADRASCFS